jgi:hypothetical protein
MDRNDYHDNNERALSKIFSDYFAGSGMSKSEAFQMALDLFNQQGGGIESHGETSPIRPHSSPHGTPETTNNSSTQSYCHSLSQSIGPVDPVVPPTENQQRSVSPTDIDISGVTGRFDSPFEELDDPVAAAVVTTTGPHIADGNGYSIQMAADGFTKVTDVGRIDEADSAQAGAISRDHGNWVNTKRVWCCRQCSLGPPIHRVFQLNLPSDDYCRYCATPRFDPQRRDENCIEQLVCRYKGCCQINPVDAEICER